MISVLFASIISDTAKEFGVDWPHFIAQVVSFLIVAGLLYKFAYKRILQVLEERRQTIAQGLANAERIKQELARTEAARDEILRKTNEESNRLIAEARAAAERVGERETQKAIAAAEDIITKAREAAAAEHARMLAELKREIGRLVVSTTANVTGKILTPEDQRRLLDETNRQVSVQA